MTVAGAWRLFDNPPMPVNGEMTVPAGPGLGLNFAPDLLANTASASALGCLGIVSRGAGGAQLKEAAWI